MDAKWKSGAVKPPVHHDVVVSGIRLHAFEWAGPGATIILVHGTGFHGYVWKPIAGALSHRHRVLAIDLRGHGDSDKPSSGYELETLGDDLYGFLCALGLFNVIAVGHSAGATAIAHCAAHHPGLVGKAVLIDPILFRGTDVTTPVNNPFAERARKRRMVWPSRQEILDSYRRRPPFKTWREDVLQAYVEWGTYLTPAGTVVLKCPGDIEAQCYEDGARLNGFAFLPQLDFSTLVLRGERSEALSAASAAEVIRLLPKGRLVTIAETTHFMPMERPDIVEMEVQAFVEQGAARSRMSR